MVRYEVNSAAHLGRFHLVEKRDAGGRVITLLEGPDGRLFRASDVLPVLSEGGQPVALTGADVVLCWIIQPGRGPKELAMGLRYLEAGIGPAAVD